MKYLFIIFLLFFSACTYKTTPVIIAFKKDKLTINDQGFLKENDFSKKIEVYNIGNLIFTLSINSATICINDECYNKKLFIKQINKKYPDNLLEIIIDKKPLPNIKMIKTNNGFIQKTDNIFYKVNKNRVLFKDKTNKFLFLLKYHK